MERPILHIMVVGFHHKKGCQVEFSYPPLVEGSENTNDCPPGWKYLPTLALPDGSHNFVEDSVFFNLPSLSDPKNSIYGVSCYRQIPVEKLKIRTADVTRSTVQKSVCVLTSLPVYGYIEVKLSLIAHAFFEQGDFSSVKILINAYNQLNACLMSEAQLASSPLDHINVGLPLREIVLRWRHKTLLLYKLMLLQKKVICFGSPVRPICTLILSIVSLHPRLLADGFHEVACVRTSRPLSPMPDFSSLQVDSPAPSPVRQRSVDTASISGGEETTSERSDDLSSSDSKSTCRQKNTSLPRDASVDTLAVSLLPLCSVDPLDWSAPLPIFEMGHLCLPYLSLPYMDLLTDASVQGFLIGASNILFQQKRRLADVHIDVEAGTIETQDHELRRQLVLTTEDLRFVDFIIRHVQNPKEGAEGSENWIRDQFRGYQLAMLKTALLVDVGKETEHFNGPYMAALKKTLAFNEWYEQVKSASVFENVPTGHPFAGTLSVADMKLKLAQTMHNSESGRKINQAVNTTSRAVGGALSQAKGAFSNWWSAITTTAPQSGVAAGPGGDLEVIGDSEEMENEHDCCESDGNLVDLQQSNDGMNDAENNRNELNCEVVKSDDKLEVEVTAVPRRSEGIIEIAKEAEYFEANQRKIGEMFTV